MDRYYGAVRRYVDWKAGCIVCKHGPKEPGCALGATERDIETYVGIYAHERGLKPQSRLGDLAALRSLYRYLLRREAIKTDPTARVSYPAVGRPLPKAMSVEYADKVLMAPGIHSFIGLRDTAMIAVLIGTGIRLSGLVNLTDRSLLWHKRDDKEHLALRVEEKGKVERIVPAPLEVALLLRAYMGHSKWKEAEKTNKQGAQVLWLSTRPNCAPHEWIGDRRRLKKDTIQNVIDKYCKAVGVPEGYRKAHAFRHLFGAELAEADVDLLTRQVLLGHARPETTAIYTHLAQRKLVEVSERSNPLNRIDNGLLRNLRAIQRAI